jgi:hypothetical protein
VDELFTSAVGQFKTGASDALRLTNLSVPCSVVLDDSGVLPRFVEDIDIARLGAGERGGKREVGESSTNAREPETPRGSV